MPLHPRPRLLSTPISPASPLPTPVLHPPLPPSSLPPAHDFPLDALPPTPSLPPPPPSLLTSLCPPSLLPYLLLSRVDKPIGTLLLLFPCYFSLALSTLPSHLPPPTLLLLFALGAFTMRGAGCTINDLWDHRLDAAVARTLTRPLPSNLLTPPQALAWLFAQLSLSLLTVLSFNLTTIALSFAICPLVLVYPLMKRVTHFPQLCLGLAFNWGALVGYTAHTATLHPAVTLPLYLAGVAWTMHYDTIYAHQDALDDAKLGLGSTALRWGETTREWLGMMGVVMVGGLVAAGWGGGMGWWYYVGGVGGVVGHLGWQLWRLDVRDRARCWRLFVSNRWIGWILLSAMVVDRWMMERDDGKERQREETLRKSRESRWGRTGYELIVELIRGEQPQLINASPASATNPTSD